MSPVRVILRRKTVWRSVLIAKISHFLGCAVNVYSAVITSLGLIVSSPSIFADIPVIDFANITQTAAVVSQLKTQYQTLMNQYTTLKAEYQSIVGNYGWGTFHNSLSQLQKIREWAPSNWQQALQGLSGGNPQRYQQLLRQYAQNHSSMQQSQYARGADSKLAQIYHNQASTAKASAAQASYAFNNINHHLKTLYQLGQSVEDATKNHNIKSAIDLNSRIELEVGYVEVAELRMQALINEQISQMQSSTVAEETEKSSFNQAGVGT